MPFDRVASSSARETWYVAVTREVKESESVLLWAIENLKNLGGTEICLLHVHRPDKQIPTGMSWLSTVPVEHATEDQIDYHRTIERQKLAEKMDKYLHICRKRQVKARQIHVEMESIEEGILKLLNVNEVGKLVMGAASDKRYRKGMMEIRSEKAKYVNKHAPSYCHIWFVCIKLLIHTREATVQPAAGNLRAFLEYNQDLALSPNSGEIIGTSSGRITSGEISGTSSSRITSGEFSRTSSSRVTSGEFSGTSSSWITSGEFSGTSSSRTSYGYVLMERIEILEKEKTKISKELEDVRYQKFEFDSRIEKSDLKVKELEKNLASTMKLAEDYKKEREEMERERDTAIRRVEEARKQLSEGGSSVDFLMFCSEFTSLEIRSATNSFDPSMKTGEDAYGNIYKGFLRFTQVLVKIPHPDNPLVPQEFRQEVEISCKLRHPNIVNLIGICPESHVLIYEHCLKGTLEELLTNKDQGSPFPWEIRVKIATELCIVLAFLHSHKPKPVIHGDLRPARIHLDSNYACKLNGFKISNAISNGEFSLENKGSFYRGDSEVQSYPYIDPEFFAGGDLTTRSDVYALGVILMQLLTGKPALRLSRLVQNAVKNDKVSALVDSSAGWPLDQAKLLADLALRCCEMAHDRRPDLQEDVRNVLESMKGS